MHNLLYGLKFNAIIINNEKLKECMLINIKKFAFGFTLAEVLITLGIIGVVAAMTIPTLMNNTNRKETITALKKSYSTLSQAYTFAVQENGTPDTWGLSTFKDEPGGINIINILAKYLKVTKNCTSGTGCFPNVTYKLLSGGDWINVDSDKTFSKAILSDGTLLTVQTYGACTQSEGTTPALSHACGSLRVDVNGNKKPNQMGLDLFSFYLTPYGIVPMGTQNEGAFDTDCKNKATMSGDACAAWVLYNDNMDYLNCSNLSWSGPLSCN